MSNENYQNEYKKIYKQKNKIVTFPLSNIFYEELRKRAFINDLKTNSFAKSVITSYLNNTKLDLLTKEKKELISEYIRISRGVANNINQIAYKTNIQETLDIQILLNSLRIYEEEFKNFITKA